MFKKLLLDENTENITSKGIENLDIHLSIFDFDYTRVNI